MKVGQLLGLAEIGERGVGQAAARQRHDALIALHLLARIDGDGEMPAAEQRAFVEAAVGGGRGKARLVAAHVAAHAPGSLEVDDEEVEDAVGLGLHDELAVEFQRGAEHGRQRHRLAQRLRDRIGHVVMRQDRVDGRARAARAGR